MNSIADSLLLAAQLISRADADLWRIVALSLRVADAAAVGAASMVLRAELPVVADDAPRRRP